MTDMLVRLYALPDRHAAIAAALAQGVTVRRPEAWERTTLVAWIGASFSPGWASECELAFAARPVSCFIAVERQTIVGFACHDCTRPNFFGPAGVAPGRRGHGIGAALTLAALGAMHDAGYAYAIIGGTGPEAFYARVAGAVPIAGSTPGIYDFSLIQRTAPPQSGPI